MCRKREDAASHGRHQPASDRCGQCDWTTSHSPSPIATSSRSAPPASTNSACRTTTSRTPPTGPDSVPRRRRHRPRLLRAPSVTCRIQSRLSLHALGPAYPATGSGLSTPPELGSGRPWRRTGCLHRPPGGGWSAAPSSRCRPRSDSCVPNRVKGGCRARRDGPAPVVRRWLASAASGTARRR
jgi:hypothetical protein